MHGAEFQHEERLPTQAGAARPIKHRSRRPELDRCRADQDEWSRPRHHSIEGRIEDMPLVGQHAPTLQVPEQEGTLPTVVEQEARIGEPQPAHLNRQTAKVPHIRVHGFPTGDRQHDEPEDHQTV